MKFRRLPSVGRPHCTLDSGCLYDGYIVKPAPLAGLDLGVHGAGARWPKLLTQIWCDNCVLPEMSATLYHVQKIP